MTFVRLTPDLKFFDVYNELRKNIELAKISDP